MTVQSGAPIGMTSEAANPATSLHTRRTRISFTQGAIKAKSHVSINGPENAKMSV